MSSPRWTLRDREVVISTPWLQVEKNRYSRDGHDLDDYYILRRSGFVVVIAVDDDDSVVLVREYRAATDETYLAFPAGYIEPGERPLQAAERELREETGATGRHWRALGRLDPLPGYIDSAAHVFRCDLASHDVEARVAEAATGERLEVISLTRTAVRAAIVAGEMKEMQAVAAFLLADEVERQDARGDQAEQRR